MTEGRTDEGLLRNGDKVIESSKEVLKFDYEAKLERILEKLGDADASQLLQTLCLRNVNAGEILDELDKINEKQLNKTIRIQDKIINQIIDYKSDLDLEKISEETEEEEKELTGAVNELQDKDTLDFQKLLNLVVIFLRDKHIGNIKKLISNVEKDQYDLKALARIGEFTGLIAHVIRNPLANILITADVLYSKFEAGDERRSYVETIISEIEKLESKIEDMVNYKDIKESKDVRPDEADLHEIINIVLADLQRKFNDQNIKVTTTFSSEIPKVLVLSTKIEESFLNILQNMIDALSENGEIKIETRLTNEIPEEKREIIIVMEDNGEGILPGNIDHIFDPCFTTKKSGMGLGLYMTKKFIGDHGGSLKVENKPAGGAMFTIILPVKPVITP